MSGGAEDSTQFKRPYLVIPKLIEQPTWGGTYIAEFKQWDIKPSLAGSKIGQSYELFSGSNLSLLDSSKDPLFEGEITDRDEVQNPTSPENSVSLASLIEMSAKDTLGSARAVRSGRKFDLLIKFTQSLGNSFQIHIKDGLEDPWWKPKPESWYYLEPGLITLGVKSGVDWGDYEAAVSSVAEAMTGLERQISTGELDYDEAQAEVHSLLERYDPWVYVNTVEVKKDQLVDLSAGALHHSWEEDSVKIPLGNVLYELQLEAMDDVSTIRVFDKGKMTRGGSLRKLNISDYFRLIDRTPEANDPKNHMGEPTDLIKTAEYGLSRLLSTKYYTLNKLLLLTPTASYNERIDQFRHLFVRKGEIQVSTELGSVIVSQGHACFIPAGAMEYRVECKRPATEVLISY